MVLKLYYEPGIEGELERFRDYCEFQEFSSGEELERGRALLLSSKGLGLITPGFAQPLYIKRDKGPRKPFISNLVRACIPKTKRYSKTYSILDAFSGFGYDTLALAPLNLVNSERTGFRNGKCLIELSRLYPNSRGSNAFLGYGLSGPDVS